jgi:hypothetical protein
MLGSEILEVVIGLVFIYLLFSTLVTLINEFIVSVLKLRAKGLKKIIKRTLDNEEGNELSDEFFKHPLIKYLAKGKRRPASYLSNQKFAKVVMDLIRTKGDVTNLGQTSILDQKTISQTIEDNEVCRLKGETRSLMLSFAKESADDINDFGRRLEAWFDEMNQRGHGWFKRQLKWITFGVSLAVAIGFNLDSVAIYDHLSKNPELRAEVFNEADQYMKDVDPLDFQKVETTDLVPIRLGLTQTIDSAATDSSRLDAVNNYYKAKSDLATYYKGQIKDNKTFNALGIGEFWKAPDKGGWCYRIIGWLLSAFALSLGAPFWFDMLNKLIALRSSLKSKEGNVNNSDQINLKNPVG